MFETRSRFDNRYVTKELRELDLKRVRQGRETVLPLNVRERAKYVTVSSSDIQIVVGLNNSTINYFQNADRKIKICNCMGFRQLRSAWWRQRRFI